MIEDLLKILEEEPEKIIKLGFKDAHSYCEDYSELGVLKIGNNYTNKNGAN